VSKKVFISYAWNDQHLAQNTIRQLCKKGWLSNDDLTNIDSPEESNKGDYIRNQIKERIQKSDIVILVWSKQAAKSPWVQYEVGMAQALDRPILIAWADDSAPELPTEIEENQVVRLDAEPA
jgi:hypothetical protein